MGDGKNLLDKMLFYVSFKIKITIYIILSTTGVQSWQNF